MKSFSERLNFIVKQMADTYINLVRELKNCGYEVKSI